MEVFSTIYTAVMSPWQPKSKPDEFDIHEDEDTPEKISPMKMSFADEKDSENAASPANEKVCL